MNETRERYDLAIVGGGVQGAALLLEATRRGLGAALVEQGDFGAGTTSRSLRIVHGGLRDLKRLDLARCREMAAAQAEWLRDFPDEVRPLDCVLPLGGPAETRVARAGLALHALATRDLRDLPAGRIVEREDLGRCATWTEGLVVDPRRLVEAMIERARRQGGVAHERTEVIGFARESRSLRVVDRSTGARREIEAERVVVTAGHATDEVLRRLGARTVEKESTSPPSLAWNLVLDRPPPLENAALVVSVDGGTRLLVPGPDGASTVAGTFHAPLEPGASPPNELPERLVRASIDELNHARAALGIERREIVRVLHGVLPVTRPGSTTLVRHSIVRLHGDDLASIVAVKLTTTRGVARRFLDREA